MIIRRRKIKRHIPGGETEIKEIQKAGPGFKETSISSQSYQEKHYSKEHREYKKSLEKMSEKELEDELERLEKEREERSADLIEEIGDKRRKSFLLGIGMGVGSELISDKIVKDVIKREPTNSGEAREITRKLRDEIKKRGGDYHYVGGLNNAFYSPEDIDVDKDGRTDIKKGDIYLDSDIKDPSIIAHEMGHKKAHDEGGIKKKITLSSGPISAYGSLASIANGYRSGYHKGKYGEESKLSKHSVWALPIITHIPQLASEGIASKYAMDELRNQGASEELLDESGHALNKAYGSYLIGPSSLAFGIGSAYIGKGLGYANAKADEYNKYGKKKKAVEKEQKKRKKKKDE